MLMVLFVFSIIVGIVQFGCYVYTVIVAFQNEEPIIGIICLCPLLGFIMGWVKVGQWNHMITMAIWTACIAVGFIFNLLSSGM